MGMAASQARYLGLTARKTNVEYEGQQINQQRTALANQSANFYNQLYTLTVPTPPSTSQYTKTQYSYSDGTNTETITNIAPLAVTDPEYNYTVTHYHTASVYTGVETKTVNPQVKKEGSPSEFTYVGNSPVTKYDASDSDQSAAVAQIIKSMPTSCQFVQDYNAGHSGATNNIYKFTSGGVTYYACKTDLQTSYDSKGGDINNQTTLNKYNATYLSQKITTTEEASLTQDSSGRFTTAKLESSSATYDLTAESVTDTNAYNDAMNQYNYNTQIYEQQVNDINAKTSIIQQEDRTLELRLRQLDTEQQALSTEMDAVKKVIDKNIESTFKTFSS